MDLNFNACLSLLIIAFIFALIVVRAFGAYINRCFRLVDYAQEKLYPGGKQKTGRTGPMDIVYGIVEPLVPEIGKVIKNAVIGKGDGK